MKLLTEKEAADFLKRKPKTLRDWRSLKKGPPFIIDPLGKIHYSADALEKWIMGGATKK